ncbi:DUF423 domain-containing protein [Inquilinus limosus]|uniref:DUF423 domain-containing protein n=1 Tax=Inquilinus limosus TaxID=171674 RepID=UPI003F17CB10
MIDRVLLIGAGLHGAIAVAMGAFAAHGMANAVPERLGWVQTGAHYQLVHAAALLALALLGLSGPLRWAGWAFLVGAAIFSGTLYLMAFGAPRWFGAITPIGGVLLILGWALAALAAFRAAES